MSENVCSKCGVQLKEGARFCKACGSGSSMPDEELAREKRLRVTASERKGQRLLGWSAAAVVLVAAAGLLLFLFLGKGKSAVRKSGSAGRQPSFTVLTSNKGEVAVPLAGMSDGRARFYSYSDSSGAVKFFVLQKKDGTYGAALDACNACYSAKLGYRDQGDHVICNNCGMEFQPDDIGIVSGGCNPIPLTFSVARQTLSISVAELMRYRYYF